MSKLKIYPLLILAILFLAACTAWPGATPASIEKKDGDLWVRLGAPQDRMTVNTAQVEVNGQAPEETTITVNDNIIVVSPDQSFTSTVPLEVGPNVIEVVASNMSGNEVSFTLTVFYQP
jgi:PBP1b-binding outer membrane lipoprotein LpoB